jgi:polar amino acid transport system ATP-binding protein
VTLLLEGIAIWKSYGDDDVLKGVDLKVQEGECLVLIGPSGSGKSTLLKCLNLLEPISSGSIVFQGEEIAFLRRGEAVSVRRRIGHGVPEL